MKVNRRDSGKIQTSLFYLACWFVFYPAGTHFQRIIPESGPAASSPEKVKRVIFCTGKIYYELTRERKNRGMEEAVAVVRIEQVGSPILNLKNLSKIFYFVATLTSFTG